MRKYYVEGQQVSHAEYNEMLHNSRELKHYVITDDGVNPENVKITDRVLSKKEIELLYVTHRAGDK